MAMFSAPSIRLRRPTRRSLPLASRMREMESQVGLDVPLQRTGVPYMPRNAASIRAIGAAERARGRHAGGGGLDDAAQIGDIGEEFGIGSGLQAPAHDVRIDLRPVAGGAHARTGAWTHLHQALAREDLDGFAHDRAADAEFAGETILHGQRVARDHVSSHDPQTENTNQMLVQARPRVFACLRHRLII